MLALFLGFEETSIHSHQQYKRVPFYPHPLPHLLFLFFNDSSSDWCEVIYHCSFDVHLMCISNVEHLFMCFMAIGMYSLEKCLLRSSAHFLLGLFVF